MFGKNPIRPPTHGDGSELFVQEIFLTIQGEGPFVGQPAIFLRLGGCNLACTFCDTEFENFSQLSLTNILQQISALKAELQTNLVVITGGEPLRQPIAQLCQLLIDNAFKVQIETNGTLFRPLPKEVFIICSPKPSNLGYQMIREDLLEYLSAIKFLVSTTMPNYTNIAEVGQSKAKVPVYIQPMDEQDVIKNQRNTKYAIELVQKLGYVLSLQIHKFINIK